MTPAVVEVKRAGTSYRLHEYKSTGTGSWGIEAAELLGVDPQRVFKTLIVQVDRSALVVGIVPVVCELNLKALAAAARGKRQSLLINNSQNAARVTYWEGSAPWDNGKNY